MNNATGGVMNDIADFNEGTKPNASVMVMRATKTRYMTFPYFENMIIYFLTIVVNTSSQ